MISGAITFNQPLKLKLTMVRGHIVFESISGCLMAIGLGPVRIILVH